MACEAGARGREAFARGSQLNTLLYFTAKSARFAPDAIRTLLPNDTEAQRPMLRRASESNASSSKNGQAAPSSPSFPRSSSSRKHRSKAPPQVPRSRSSTYVHEAGPDLGPNGNRRYIPPYQAAPVKLEPWSPPLTPTQEDTIIKAYASLPSSPRLSTVAVDLVPPKSTGAVQSTKLAELANSAPPFSLWEYLREELLATDFDSHQELKWERVSNFLSVPIGVEKVRRMRGV